MVSLPDLLLPKHEFFGLSIDRTSLRAVQVDHKGKITAIAEVKFPQEVFTQSTLVNGEIFYSSLQSLLKQAKFTTPYVVACFPEAFAYTRELVLPKIAVSELQEAVNWHVKDLFPFPKDDLYFDWKIIKSTEENYILAVVATTKKTIDPIVNVLVRAGLKPLRFKPDASTIARLLNLKPDEHALVAEVNRSVAYVTLVEGEKAVFTTVIPFTKDDTAQTYLKNIKDTISEIKTYYKEKGIITSEALDTVLTGEVASDQWVHELPSPAKILKTPPGNPSFNKAYAVSVFDKTDLTEEHSINLLPNAMKDQYSQERITFYYKALLFRSLSVVGAYCVFVALVFGFVMVQQQELDGSVKKLNDAVATSQASSQNLLKVNATAKKIVELSTYKKTPKETFTAILELMPPGIVLSQWDYDDSKVLFTITGVAEGREALLDLKQKLEDSNQFTKISFPLSFLESPKNINFSISFSTK